MRRMPELVSARIASRASDAAEKHDRYFLTLTFTLLAASVQTAQWTHNRRIGALEIVGWILFASSGILGLYRDRQAAVFFLVAAESAAARETGDDTASHPAARVIAEVSYGVAKKLD